MTTRRSFVRLAAASAAASALGLEARQAAPPGGDGLRILVLGGTGFLGPNVVRAALADGHRVTLFNRGVTNPHLFPELEKLRGDRDSGDLGALRSRTFDVAIDTSAILPRWVRDSAGMLAGQVGQYLFVSSISVYRDTSKVGIDELSPLARLADPASEVIAPGTFGGLKVLAEGEVRSAFPGTATIVRPGLLAGPGDPTDRFTYWPVRIDRGGEVLAPGNPSDPVQLVDVRDLAGFVARLAGAGTFGIYNAVGPLAPLSIAEMLHGVRAVTAADVRFTWVRTEFLFDQGVAAWTDLPVWVPPRNGLEGFARISNRRGVAAGLTFRPLAATARDTLDWYHLRDAERRPRLDAGLSAQREVEVLTAWHNRRRRISPDLIT